ncbi:MAG: hypothetical protein ABSE76_01635 [Minisyncoccia bacterium]|jgi:hypothetical protein
MTQTLKLSLILVGIVTFSVLIIWFFFFRSSATSTISTTALFGTSTSNTTTATPNTNTNTNTATNGTLPASQSATQKIFEINGGPIAGATLIQTLHPTTTLARYVNQEDGHVYDAPLDVPGAVPRVVSDVTIPGIEQVVWLEQGNAAILQYIDTDGATVKSVYLGLPAATTSTQLAATRIQFLPDNIIDLAASPDGKNVAYLLKTSDGSSGYIAKSDGIGAKKLFSLPLAQVLVSWPAPSTLLVQSKLSVGVPGIVFSVDAKSGAVTPLVYAEGLTATANSAFSMLLYQISDGTTKTSYLHDVKSGLNALLPINPSPEQCIWDNITNTVMYCAAPIQSVPANYLDLWHQGLASSADNIFRIYTNLAAENVVASPGGTDGGVASDILEMALSPDEHYLSFTTKGTRELWGVRLAQ